MDVDDLELRAARERGELDGVMNGFGILGNGARDSAVMDGVTSVRPFLLISSTTLLNHH